MTRDEWWAVVKGSADVLHAIVRDSIGDEAAGDFNEFYDTQNYAGLGVLLRAARDVAMDDDGDPPAGFGDLCLLCDAEVEL